MGREFGNSMHYMSERMIYHQSFNKTTKSALATLLMSYFLYYNSNFVEEEAEAFIRTMKEIQEDTGMTRSEIIGARDILVKLNWVIYKVKDAPPKTYYSFAKGIEDWYYTRPSERKIV